MRRVVYQEEVEPGSCRWPWGIPPLQQSSGEALGVQVAVSGCFDDEGLHRFHSRSGMAVALRVVVGMTRYGQYPSAGRTQQTSVN